MSHGHTPGPDHDRFVDDLGPYLLEALPGEEREDFEAHLAECAACREDLAYLEVASAALPASVEQLSPPPELKRRIMAVVESEAELLAAAGAGADRPAASERRRRFSLPSLRPAFALAGVMGLILLGGIIGVALDDDTPRAVDEGRTVAAQVDANFAKGARAELVVHDQDSMLKVSGMPVPRGDRVYQVWLKRPGKGPEPTAALFVPRADGSGSVSVPGSLRGVEQVLVTKEPKSGSQRPTTSPIIAASPA